jgi:glycosyltransferase involved in cell wall biosynthesis
VLLYGKWARGKPEKGFDNVLSQWLNIKKVYPTASLRLAGRFGDCTIKTDIHKFPDITYCGILNHSQLAIEMRSSDVILFPSVNDWCSMFCLESMASGTPVVYHPSGGTTEIMGDTGIAIKNNDLTLAIKEALGNIGKAQAARARIEKSFTKEIMCENYMKVINTL